MGIFLAGVCCAPFSGSNSGVSFEIGWPKVDEKGDDGGGVGLAAKGSYVGVRLAVVL